VPDIPQLASPDATLLLLRDGYTFIQKRARHFHSDAFAARLLTEHVIFLTGAEAAELFYDSARFQRAGALPLTVRRTLFGEAGVQTLDGDAHRARKAAFLSLMSRANLQRFLELLERGFRDAADRWQDEGRIVLFDEAERVLCRTACSWAGAPPNEAEFERLVQDCEAMVAGFGSLGPRMWRALRARKRAEDWASSVILGFRKGWRQAADGAAARVFAEYEDGSGNQLPLRVAAVELLNVVRPTTALAWWMSFIPLALREHPEQRARLERDDEFVDAFVQELRRFYPFTPFLGARSRHDFEWRGVQFRAGQLVILDVYGTLHDPRQWRDPEQFRPQRFLEGQPASFAFIPNGGGDFALGHRCAGEWLSVEALKRAVLLLTRELSFDLPPQDSSFSLRRIPTRPESGVILTDVRQRTPRRVDSAPRATPAHAASAGASPPPASR
jgi:fatty-acid peroxygenase